MAANPPPDTRTPVLTDAQVDRIIAAMRQGGASVNVNDPRVSQVQTWILGLVGVGLISAGAWAGQSLNTLSGTLASAVQRLDQQSTTLADHEQRLRDQERKP